MSEHTDPARDVEALASVLDRHVTDAAFESGCRLSCGYDGVDLTEHMAEAVLASDWLAADRARIRAETLAEVEQKLLAADTAITFARRQGRGASAMETQVRSIVRGMAEAGEPDAD